MQNTAIVVGNTGTIGAEFARQLGLKGFNVIGLNRQNWEQFDLRNESAIETFAKSVAQQGPVHLVIDATGALTINNKGPEKRLADLNPDHLRNAFEINTIGRAMLLKHLIPLMPSTERSVFAALSARVGSIEDNKLGGWYGYRAAKAAGNMLLQTAAVETFRTKKQSVFVALQPGTVVSNLSKPFAAGHPTVDVKDSVAGMLAAIEAAQPTGRAHFLDYQGNQIPW